MNIRIAMILASLFITLSFQACERGLEFSSSGVSLSKSGANGEPYTGKPDIYTLTLATNQCTDIGANGNPLPNSQIFIFPSGFAQLVRENCLDIVPRPLSPEEFTRDPSGSILYQGQMFVPLAQHGDFDIVAASCPVGSTPLQNPIRQSLLKGSLDLLSPSWQTVTGFSAELAGSLASLPAYRLQVLDPVVTQGWNGLSQTQVLAAQETYVFSFFVSPNATERATYSAFFWNNHDLQIEFDLSSGKATVQKSLGVSQLSTTARMFGGGLYVSVYYQLAAASSSNMGVKISTPTAGSAIIATAFQLEKLSSFCSP